jgi:hypothetical protein
MRIQIRLIRTDSDEAKAYVAARGAGMPGAAGTHARGSSREPPTGWRPQQHPARFFASDPFTRHAEVAALRAEDRIPVLLGEGVADLTVDGRVFALHEIHYDSPEEAERITGTSK